MNKKQLTYNFFYKYFNEDIIDPTWVDENIQTHMFMYVQNNISSFLERVNINEDNSYAYTVFCKNMYEQIKTKITNNLNGSRIEE